MQSNVFWKHTQIKGRRHISSFDYPQALDALKLAFPPPALWSPFVFLFGFLGLTFML